MASPIAPTARPPSPSLSGLTEAEARGFHSAFLMSFIGFTLVAIIAHWLVWQWRPWIPGVEGYPVPAAQTGAAPSAPTSGVVVASITP